MLNEMNVSEMNTVMGGGTYCATIPGTNQAVCVTTNPLTVGTQGVDASVTVTFPTKHYGSSGTKKPSSSNNTTVNRPHTH